MGSSLEYDAKKERRIKYPFTFSPKHGYDSLAKIFPNAPGVRIMKITQSSQARKFSLFYSIFLLVIAISLQAIQKYGSHGLAHTLANLTGLLVAPVLYSAILHPRRYYLLNYFMTIVAAVWIFFYIHDTLLESYSILTIVGIIVFFSCDLIGRSIENKKGLEEELLFVKDALETRVELRTAELQFLNRQLTADLEMLKKADEARQQSEARLRTLINAIPDSILRIRCDGVCLEYKPGEGIDEAFNQTPGEEFVLTDIMPAKTARQLLAYVQKALETQLPQQFEFQYEQHGAVNHFEVRLVVLSNLEILVMIRNMTESKRLEKEILEISQREQDRIGQDLHDGLGQLLTGISCLIRGLVKKMERKSPEEVESVNEIADLVKEAIAQTSWLARGLMPVKLDAGGLEGALQELVEQTERIHGIPCMFQCAPNLPITDSTATIHLYRIAQEAINNAVKHSRAGHIWLRLQPENGYVALTVKDDGVGLPSVGARSNGMGLRIMHYRAGIIGAELEVVRDPDGGTIVQCRFRKTETFVLDSPY